jgi:hypothetical protein
MFGTMTTPPFPVVKGDYFTGWTPARIIRCMEAHGRISGPTGLILRMTSSRLGADMYIRLQYTTGAAILLIVVDTHVRVAKLTCMHVGV